MPDAVELLPTGELGEIVIRGHNVFTGYLDQPEATAAADRRGRGVRRRVPSAEDILAYGKEHLGRHKYPRRVEFVEALPLGPSHKVLKRELRDRFGGGK